MTLTLPPGVRSCRSISFRSAPQAATRRELKIAGSALSAIYAP